MYALVLFLIYRWPQPGIIIDRSNAEREIEDFSIGWETSESALSGSRTESDIFCCSIYCSFNVSKKLTILGECVSGSNLKFGLIKEEKSKWLINADEIIARYRPGSMLYEINDKMLGDEPLNISVIPLADAEGIIVKVDYKV